MGDTKRPRPSDEGAVTKRWRPGEDQAPTAEMPAVPSRRATVAMGAVKPPSSAPASMEPIPESRLPTRIDTLPPATMMMTSVDRANVEMIIVEENQTIGGEKKAWRAAEVWTKRRVYGLDSTFKCIEIIDRETGKTEPGHDMMGARLGGGRQRAGDKVRFSYPLPLPGMEAMFMKAKKHGYTSPVERMVVRLRVLVTSPDEAMPSWDEIGSRWSEPPSK